MTELTNSILEFFLDAQERNADNVTLIPLPFELPVSIGEQQFQIVGDDLFEYLIRKNIMHYAVPQFGPNRKLHILWDIPLNFGR